MQIYLYGDVVVALSLHLFKESVFSLCVQVI